MLKSLLVLCCAGMLAAPTLAAETLLFTRVHGADTIVEPSSPLDLNWNFRNLPRWDEVAEILSVSFELRLRDDARTRANDDEDEFFRYVMLDPNPNFRLIGDPSLQLPDGAGNTDFTAQPLDGEMSSNGSVFLFADLLDGRFQTRVRATSGDFEFRSARITIEARLLPEPTVPALLAIAGFAAWSRRRFERERA